MYRALDNSVREYHDSLQTKTEDELSNLHKFNMSELDKLNQQLKASMAVIDVQVPDAEMNQMSYSPEIPSDNLRKVSFATTTMKRDNQRASMEDELLKFRQ